MYRKQMANSEGNLITDRIRSVPIVSSTVNQVADVYSKTRERNALFRLSFAAMEKSFSLATNIALTSAKPIYSKFDQQLMILNNIACTQMDNVEKKYPLITKPTDEVLKVTMDTCTAAISPVLQYVDAVQAYKEGAVTTVKNFSCNTVSSTTAHCQSVAKQLNDQVMGNKLSIFFKAYLDNTVDYIDVCTDKYLPNEDGNEDKLKDEELLFRKMIHISRKLTRRVVNRCLRQGVQVKDAVDSTYTHASKITCEVANSTYSVAKNITSNTYSIAKTTTLNSLDLARIAANKTIPASVVPNMHYYLDYLDDYMTNYFQDEILSQKELSKAPADLDVGGVALKIFYLGNKAFFCVTNRCKTNISKSQYTNQFITMPIETAHKYLSSGWQIAEEFWKDINLTMEQAADIAVDRSSNKMTMYNKSVVTARHIKAIGTVWFHKMAEPFFFVSSFIIPSSFLRKSEVRAEPSPKKAMDVQILQQLPNTNANTCSNSNLRLNNIADVPETATSEPSEKPQVAGQWQEKEAELEVVESTSDEDEGDDESDDEFDVDKVIGDKSYSDAYKCNAYSFDFDADNYHKNPYYLPHEK